MPGSLEGGLLFFQVMEMFSETPDMLPTLVSLVMELFPLHVPLMCLTGFLVSILKAEAFYEELGLIIAGA